MEKIFSVHRIEEGTKLAILLVVLQKIAVRRAEFRGMLEETFEAFGDFKIRHSIY